MEVIICQGYIGKNDSVKTEFATLEQTMSSTSNGYLAKHVVASI